jgi:hypothetical protein
MRWQERGLSAIGAETWTWPIEKQVRFWQNRSRIDKGVVAADLLDLSFIGEESAANAHASMRTTFSASSIP